MEGDGFIKPATVVTGLTLDGMAAFSSYTTSAEIDNARKQVSALEEEKRKVESVLNQLEALKADTAVYVKQLGNNLAVLTDELSQLEVRIDDKEAETKTTRTEPREAENVEGHQYSTMKLRVKYMYENGESNSVSMVMELGNISELLSRSECMSQVAKYDRRMLWQHAEAKDDVAVRERNLEQERQNLVELQETTQAKQFSIQKLVDSEKAGPDSYNARVASAQTEIDQYNADIGVQEDQVKHIETGMKRREEEAGKKTEAVGETYTAQNLESISFKWPCPSSNWITSSFGNRESPIEGASSNCKGIDIGASTGVDTIAAAGGEMVIFTYSYSAGNYIIFSHGGGVSTVYMHCSKLLAGVGGKVEQGQAITEVGSTGHSTGSHLYFGIRSGGMYVNPRGYVNP